MLAISISTTTPMLPMMTTTTQPTPSPHLPAYQKSLSLLSALSETQTAPSAHYAASTAVDTIAAQLDSQETLLVSLRNQNLLALHAYETSQQTDRGPSSLGFSFGKFRRISNTKNGKGQASQTQTSTQQVSSSASIESSPHPTSEQQEHYHAALFTEQKALKERDSLSLALSDAQGFRDSLAPDAERHVRLQAELDALYETLPFEIDEKLAIRLREAGPQYADTSVNVTNLARVVQLLESAAQVLQRTGERLAGDSGSGGGGSNLEGLAAGVGMGKGAEVVGMAAIGVALAAGKDVDRLVGECRDLDGSSVGRPLLKCQARRMGGKGDAKDLFFDDVSSSILCAERRDDIAGVVAQAGFRIGQCLERARAKEGEAREELERVARRLEEARTEARTAKQKMLEGVVAVI